MFVYMSLSFKPVDEMPEGYVLFEDYTWHTSVELENIIEEVDTLFKHVGDRIKGLFVEDEHYSGTTRQVRRTPEQAVDAFQHDGDPTILVTAFNGNFQSFEGAINHDNLGFECATLPGGAEFKEVRTALSLVGIHIFQANWPRLRAEIILSNVNIEEVVYNVG